LTFSTEMYRVALDFASKEQTRYYLQGVYVQRHPKDGVLLVSTDGHRMICIHDQNGFADEPGAITISLDNWEIEKNKGGFTSNTGDSRIGGTFPDWRRIVPELDLKSTENCYAGGAFNTRYVASFAKAGEMLAAIDADSVVPSCGLFPTTREIPPFSFGQVSQSRSAC
jgi:hypothetical protein